MGAVKEFRTIASKMPLGVRGRPRSFDEAEALKKATHVLWAMARRASGSISENLGSRSLASCRASTARGIELHESALNRLIEVAKLARSNQSEGFETTVERPFAQAQLKGQLTAGQVRRGHESPE
jgi:hypothetical protein